MSLFDILATWHEIAASGNVEGLDAFLAEDVVFHSPILHTPQVGMQLAKKYLAAAFQLFLNENFEYVREVIGPRDAVLEFQVELDGVAVNGVDMIKWNEDGRVVDFKVMIRPLTI